VLGASISSWLETAGVGATMAGLLEASNSGRRRVLPPGEKKNGEGPREGEA
jgi:hypothetical protein